MTFEEARDQILAAIAARLGKRVDELSAWIDYDPVSVDESAYKRVLHQRTGVFNFWAGD